MSDSYGQLEPASQTTSSERAINYSHSNNWADTLAELKISILVSTYQAEKVIVLGSQNDRPHLAFHNYQSPMGIAIDSSQSRFAVATRDKVWFANNEVGVGRQLPQPTTVCFATRSAHLTGDVQAHQLAWAGDDLWIVNTRFSCLCTLDDRHSFVPRWKPAFVDDLVGEDRCHLNGLAMYGDRPKFVTALAETNVAEGWRPLKEDAGCLIDVESHEVVARGFAMPHSPVVSDGSLFLLNSGEGTLVHVTNDGRVVEVGRFPGYTRGLAVFQDVAIVGLSKIRETSTFGGLPISARRPELKCGIALMSLTSGKLLSQFEFKTGIDEIFDVAVIARGDLPTIHGPHATQEGRDSMWIIPPLSNSRLQ